ncbi:hypothetical protein ACFSSA_14495 [Luteolibacter algae]|uniref:Uncharacterized protein n=1 Tax=Luteolibacter algae TaxID=454151 RepID=A0ABW5DBF8_9BACT
MAQRGSLPVTQGRVLRTIDNKVGNPFDISSDIYSNFHCAEEAIQPPPNGIPVLFGIRHRNRVGESLPGGIPDSSAAPSMPEYGFFLKFDQEAQGGNCRL